MPDLKDVKVLVTGGRGFLGEFVTAFLKKEGATPVIMSRRSGHDLRHFDEVLPTFLTWKPQVVVHLATAKNLTPAETFRDNVKMGMNVLEASALYGAHFMFIVGHIRCPDGHPLKAAERMLMEMGAIYRSQYSFSSTFFVAEQVYGVGSDPKGPVPIIGSALDAAKNEGLQEIQMTIPEGQPAPLLHAYDVAAAVTHAVKHARAQEAESHLDLTLPSVEPELKFGDVVGRLSEKVGYKGKVTYAEEQEYLSPLVGNEATEMLGWKPQITLDLGVRETVDWLVGSPK